MCPCPPSIEMSRKNTAGKVQGAVVALVLFLPLVGRLNDLNAILRAGRPQVRGGGAACSHHARPHQPLKKKAKLADSLKDTFCVPSYHPPLRPG